MQNLKFYSTYSGTFPPPFPRRLAHNQIFLVNNTGYNQNIWIGNFLSTTV